MDDKDFKLDDIIKQYSKKPEKAEDNTEESAQTSQQVNEAAEVIEEAAVSVGEAVSEASDTAQSAEETADEANAPDADEPEDDGIADISFPEASQEDNEKEIADISLDPENAKEEKEVSDIELDAEKAFEESDSDPIIPITENPRTDITDDGNERTQTADKAPSKKSYVRDEEDLKIIRSNKGSSSSKKKKKKKAKKSRFNNSVFGGLIIISLILTVSIVIAYNGIRLGMEYLGIGKNSNEITFNIPDGATSDQVIKLLEENDIIKEPKLFSIIMRMKNLDFYPGDITLRPSMSYAQIIDELSVNRTNRATIAITFPEGITLREAAQLLEDNKVCTKKDFIFQFNKNQGFAFENLIEESDLKFYKMEGFFFPDTYEFYLEDDAYNVARIIKEHFADKFTSSMESKMKQNGMTLNEVITLASVVQKEAGTVKDMPIVASVFINRLDNSQLFPSLESDATSNYIKNVIKKEADSNVSIKYYTEGYDTYHCKGLPAGPICNPGLDAINAVLNPEQTEYFFFCNNLDTGKAYYAKTNEEHEKNLVKAGLVSAE